MSETTTLTTIAAPAQGAMEKKITVHAKFRHGNWYFYPVCPSAETFVRMIGGKVLTLNSLAQIKKLGYEIEVKTDIPTIPNI